MVDGGLHNKPAHALPLESARAPAARRRAEHPPKGKPPGWPLFASSAERAVEQGRGGARAPVRAFARSQAEEGPHGQNSPLHPHVWAAISRCGRPSPALGRPSPGVSSHPQLRDGHPHVISAVPTCKRPSPSMGGHPQVCPAIPMLTPRAQPPPPRRRGAAPYPSPTKRAPRRSHYPGSNYFKNARPPPAPHGHQRANNRAMGGAP